MMVDKIFVPATTTSSFKLLFVNLYGKYLFLIDLSFYVVCFRSCFHNSFCSCWLQLVKMFNIVLFVVYLNEFKQALCPLNFSEDFIGSDEPASLWGRWKNPDSIQRLRACTYLVIFAIDWCICLPAFSRSLQSEGMQNSSSRCFCSVAYWRNAIKRFRLGLKY